jgi:hypothetical protein
MLPIPTKISLHVVPDAMARFLAHHDHAQIAPLQDDQRRPMHQDAGRHLLSDPQQLRRHPLCRVAEQNAAPMEAADGTAYSRFLIFEPTRRQIAASGSSSAKLEVEAPNALRNEPDSPAHGNGW